MIPFGYNPQSSNPLRNSIVLAIRNIDGVRLIPDPDGHRKELRGELAASSAFAGNAKKPHQSGWAHAEQIRMIVGHATAPIGSFQFPCAHNPWAGDRNPIDLKRT